MKVSPETMRLDRESQRQQRVVNDALDDALMATFPASDPLSMVNTLIPGARDESRNDEDLARNGTHDAPAELPLDHRQPPADMDLGITIIFVIVLLAALLMLHATNSYSFDLVASTQMDGFAAVL